jgi:hypothetical protein
MVFTTPELLEIGFRRLAHEKPTRVEALRHYRKVVDTYDLRSRSRRRCCQWVPIRRFAIRKRR